MTRGGPSRLALDLADLGIEVVMDVTSGGSAVKPANKIALEKVSMLVPKNYQLSIFSTRIDVIVAACCLIGNQVFEMSCNRIFLTATFEFASIGDA